MDLPFAAIPNALLRDRRLKPIDVRIVGLILEWCIADGGPADSGWVLNGILADRADVHVRTVQRSIDALESAGWISAEADHSNQGRRRITILWRRPGFEVPSPDDRRVMTSASRQDCHDTHVTQSKTISSKQDGKARSTPTLISGEDGPAPAVRGRGGGKSPKGKAKKARTYRPTERRPARYKPVPFGGGPGTPPGDCAAKAREMLPEFFPGATEGEAGPWVEQVARCLHALEAFAELYRRRDEPSAEIAAVRIALALGDATNEPYYRSLCGAAAFGIFPFHILSYAVHELFDRLRDRTGGRKPPACPGAYFGPVLRTAFDDWNGAYLGTGEPPVDHDETMARIEAWLSSAGAPA